MDIKALGQPFRRKKEVKKEEQAAGRRPPKAKSNPMGLKFLVQSEQSKIGCASKIFIFFESYIGRFDHGQIVIYNFF